jgi:hypothetical protein
MNCKIGKVGLLLPPGRISIQKFLQAEDNDDYRPIAEDISSYISKIMQ